MDKIKLYNLVCDGNSLTAGTGASSANLLSYPSQLRTQLITSQADHSDKYWSVKSVGISGHTTLQRTAAFLNDVHPQFSQKYGRNIVAFFEVRNDVVVNAATLEIAIANVQAYVTQARASGWEVMLATVPPNTTTTNGVNTIIPQFNAWLLANSQWSDFPIVDLAADPSLDDASDLTFFNADGTHPTDAGYAAMASVFHDVVAEVVDPDAPTQLELLKRVVYEFDQLEVSDPSAWADAVAAIATDDYKRLFSPGNFDRLRYRYLVYGFDDVRLELVYDELVDAITP